MGDNSLSSVLKLVKLNSKMKVVIKTWLERSSDKAVFKKRSAQLLRILRSPAKMQQLVHRLQLRPSTASARASSASKAQTPPDGKWKQMVPKLQAWLQTRPNSQQRMQQLTRLLRTQSGCEKLKRLLIRKRAPKPTAQSFPSFPKQPAEKDSEDSDIASDFEFA